jgi:hypothetical protein
MVELAAGLRVTHQSPQLLIATGPSGRVRVAVNRLRSQEPTLRYYLSAGSGRFRRQSWSHAQAAIGRTDAVRADWPLVEKILNFRENRHAAAAEAVEAIGGSEPALVVLEALGEVSRDDAAFLQACQLRLVPTVLLLHTGGAAKTSDPADAATAEVLLTLLLAGGVVAEAELRRWARLRGWDAAIIEANTSVRDGEQGRIYTYASNGHREAAAVAVVRAGRPVLAGLAAMVATTQLEPLIATARLADVPALALAAFAGLARGRDDDVEQVLAYAKNLFRESRKSGWREVSKGTAGALLLAALVAQRTTVSPGSVTALLNLADRFAVDPEVRVGLAYAAGQLLAKDPHPQSWTASVRCFEYAQRCVRAHPSDDPERDRSRIAAGHNGAALAKFRAGDRRGALDAELAGLDALVGPDSIDEHLREQQILLLANMAKVRSAEASRAEALDCQRRAWRLADEAGSIGGMAYVAADLVRGLLGCGEVGAARTVAERLLQRHDEAGDTSRTMERAIVATCCALAETGEPGTSAFWYVEAVRRMRRGAPRMVEAVITNVRQRPAAPAAVLDDLHRELGRHRTMAADLAVLRALVTEGDDDE